MAAGKLAAALAGMNTNGQGRAALGVISSALSRGYESLEDISTGGGGKGLRQAARDLLDETNGYAQEIYRRLPTDGAKQGEPLDWKEAGRIGLCASQADKALELVGESVDVSDFDFSQKLHDAIEDVGADVGELVAAGAGRGILAGLVAFLRQAWWVILIVVVAIVLIRRGVLRLAVKAVTP